MHHLQNGQQLGFSPSCCLENETVQSENFYQQYIHLEKYYMSVTISRFKMYFTLHHLQESLVRICSMCKGPVTLFLFQQTYFKMYSKIHSVQDRYSLFVSGVLSIKSFLSFNDFLLRTECLSITAAFLVSCRSWSGKQCLMLEHKMSLVPTLQVRSPVVSREQASGDTQLGQNTRPLLLVEGGVTVLFRETLNINLLVFEFSLCIGMLRCPTPKLQVCNRDIAWNSFVLAP